MKINNVTVKTPALSGVKTTDEPVWSSNTGRNTKGKMIGDIVAFKTTVEVTWAVLSYSEAHTIRNAIVNAMKNNNGFFDIEFPDPDGGSVTNRTLTVYAGNIPRTLYSLNSGTQFYQDVTVTFIEQ